jgi:PhoPQ-activated pathogenicity-related protein
MTVLALVLAASAFDVPIYETPLGRYAAKPDSSFRAYRAEWRGRPSIRLTSQKWQGAEWSHDVVVARPSSPENTDVWTLHVTGGAANDRDVAWAQSLADASGSPVATLFDVPNQPLFGQREDGLIAHTFERFLETGDETWPLLFPMVKAVVRCMDALDREFGPGLRFVVTGASKRGWTAWLAAATGDPRVAAIAPMVFDNLGFEAQLAKQLADWGRYSPLIRDYTSRGLQDALGTTRGQSLVSMVDPAAYLANLRTPVLMVHGANDPYWTVDATSLYWSSVKTVKKWIVAAPNAGHDLGPEDYWMPTLAVFVRSVDRRAGMPLFEWLTARSDTGAVEAKLGYERRPKSVKKWVARRPDLDFSSAEWEATDVPARLLRPSSVTLTEPPEAEWNKAVILELTYESDGVPYRLSTPPFVVKKKP